jgi:hypothetical protein
LDVITSAVDNSVITSRHAAEIYEIHFIVLNIPLSNRINAGFGALPSFSMDRFSSGY